MLSGHGVCMASMSPWKSTDNQYHGIIKPKVITAGLQCYSQ